MVKIKVTYKDRTNGIRETEEFEGEVQVLQQGIRVAKKLPNVEPATPSLIISLTVDEKEDATYIPFSSIHKFETLNAGENDVLEL